MRLLFLALAFPRPANNGYKMRMWAVLRALAAEGHEITLLSFANPSEVGDEEAVVLEGCRRVELVPLTVRSASAPNDYSGRLAALFSAVPYGVVRFRSEAMKVKIRRWLYSQQVDVVLCDTPYPIINMPAASPVPLIMSSHNIEYVLIQRYVAFERNPARKGYAWLELQKQWRWERRACSRANLVMVCSEHDRSAMVKLCPRTPVVVVPNVVDTETYHLDGKADPKTVLFQGGMDWYPNRDAVKFFISEILPELRTLVPGVRFVVAGRDGHEKFRRRFAVTPGVEFTGTVPDMRAEIAKAAVCVVPLRIGSGTRLKILEAAAMAKPIVSTRVGAEGLEFVNGQEIIVTDEPRRFAKAIADLLTNVSRRQAIGQAARWCVERKYSFPVLRVAVRQSLLDLQKGRL